MIVNETFSCLFDILRKVIDRLHKMQVQRRFRKEFVARYGKNIFPIAPFDLAVLRRVGRYSYGMLNVVEYGGSGESLEIGEFVSIAPEVVFHLGGEHSLDTFSTFPFDILVLGMPYDKKKNATKGPIIVRDDVWIGRRTLILSGVEIGQGAVIGAGSVVAKSIPPYAVAVGNPARVIKYRFSPEIIEILRKRLNYQMLTIDVIRRIQSILALPLTRERLEEILCGMGC